LGRGAKINVGNNITPLGLRALLFMSSFWKNAIPSGLAMVKKPNNPGEMELLK